MMKARRKLLKISSMLTAVMILLSVVYVSPEAKTKAKFKFNQSDLYLNEDASYTLKLNGVSKKDKKKIKWSYVNTEYVDISQKDYRTLIITPVKNGNCKIMAKLGKKSATCRLHVDFLPKGAFYYPEMVKYARHNGICKDRMGLDYYTVKDEIPDKGTIVMTYIYSSDLNNLYVSYKPYGNTNNEVRLYFNEKSGASKLIEFYLDSTDLEFKAKKFSPEMYELGDSLNYVYEYGNLPMESPTIAKEADEILTESVPVIDKWLQEKLKFGLKDLGYKSLKLKK